MEMRTLITMIVAVAAARTASADRKKDMRSYVLDAVAELARDHGNEGYSHGAYYTHDLDYSEEAQIKASRLKPKTMCVAAVAEVLVTALKLYADGERDRSVFETIPARSWTKASRDDIRPYIFMFDTVRSNGTADALEQFGIGEQVSFAELLPGDFVNLNRERTGHAVVFMGFLNATGDLVSAYNEQKVVGFKYFSSQGKDNGGLGYRWAYFDGHCPSTRDPKKPRDCGVKWSPRQSVLNTGYLLHPSLWRAKDAHAERVRAALRRVLNTELGATRRPNAFDRLPLARKKALEQRAESELSREAPGVPPADYDGATTDD
jgi:hypothetical protein